MERTKPFVIFGVNANDNPYEDLHRQDRMIDFLVGVGARFNLGAEVYKGKIVPIFFMETPDVLLTPEFKAFLTEGKQVRLIRVDHLRNVWLHFTINGLDTSARLGTFVETTKEAVTKDEWVFYLHNEEKYYKIDPNN